MSKARFIFISVSLQSVLLISACSHPPADRRLLGEWRSTKGDKLKITEKQFTLESDSPEPEDYFVKKDTIFTSYQGNLPYTKYAIMSLDDHHLKLFTPDSTTVEFAR